MPSATPSPTDVEHSPVPIQQVPDSDANVKPPTSPTGNSPIIAAKSDESRIESKPSPSISAAPKAPSKPEPASAGAVATDTPPPGEETPTKRAWGAKRLAVKHWRMGLACAGSMLLGGALSITSNPSTPTTAAPEESPKVVYVAATVRRSEPISPIVPFEGLDSNVVDLGRRLFHDSALSGNGKLSCASCHDPNTGGADGKVLSPGVNGRVTRRNTPTVFNAGYNFVQYWDGRAESLEEQLDNHLSENGEMLSDWSRVIKVLSQDPLYNRTFQLYLGGEPSEALVRQALATYERSLVTVDSKFDQWLRGNDQALNAEEIAGYYLFKQLNCISCHQGVGVGGTMLQPLGDMQGFFDSVGTVSEPDLGRFDVTNRERDRRVFRVPALRNVDQTAPYFHDGSAPTLPAAVEAMMKYQLGLEPNPTDVHRLVAFLKTLTGKPLRL